MPPATRLRKSNGQRLTALCIALLCIATVFAPAYAAPVAKGVPAQSAGNGSEPVLAVAESIVSAFRQGLLAHDQRRILRLFDRDMPGYSDFAEQLAVLFARYDTIRVYTRIIQTASGNGSSGSETQNNGTQSKDARGIAIVEITMEAAPPDEDLLPVRRTTELRFTFARRDEGWKIVDLAPRNFFAGFL